MQKSPLIYWEDGKAFLNSTHVVNFSTFTNEIGILSHFKFMSDFHEKAKIEAARKQHYNNGGEYSAYLKAIEGGQNSQLLSSDISQKGLEKLYSAINDQEI